jgi:hypothetical protein
MFVVHNDIDLKLCKMKVKNNLRNTSLWKIVNTYVISSPIKTLKNVNNYVWTGFESTVEENAKDLGDWIQKYTYDRIE